MPCSCSDNHFGECCPRIARDQERIIWEKEQTKINCIEAIPPEDLPIIAQYDLWCYVLPSPQ